jgi:SAM-dependent methyltransferase
MNPQDFYSVIHRNSFIRGEIELPCVPSLLDLYMDRLKTLFDNFGKSFTVDELAHLRSLLTEKLDQGFKLSPLSKLIFRYEPSQSPTIGITYNINFAVGSITDQYNNWAITKQPPLFGSHADAKAVAVLTQLQKTLKKTQSLKVLDIGAGTGRNSLAIARMDCKVDALELTPAFVEQIQTQAQTESLSVTAILGDILDPLTRLKPSAYNFVLCSEVTSHFRDANQLRLLLAKTCDYLQHGGLFLFNLFMSIDGYSPQPLEREMAEVAWSTFFTPPELLAAAEDLPLEIMSNESVLEFEKTHLPDGAYPPTGWFENWAMGRDAFLVENPPIHLRWVLCKRT